MANPNPYRNQHCEGCNASFGYWEYMPTCRSCLREICEDCGIKGSLDESDDGRPTYLCNDPDCAEAWDDERSVSA